MSNDCPLCGHQATTGDEPIGEGMLEPLTQVICGECGQYTILSRLAHPESEKEKLELFSESDLTYIRKLNQAAIADDQSMIWVDKLQLCDQWNETLEQQSHRLGGKAAFAVHSLPSI